ncbi:MAG: aminotransferase class V-fold PLP-dependent enzyme, partial [Ginsengibacter sp.]
MPTQAIRAQTKRILFTIIYLVLRMDFSSVFPVLKKYTYLNTAYSGLLSADIAKWRTAHDKEFVEGGSNFKETNSRVFHQLRSNLASMFDVKEENTFLVPNFSIGFNTLLNGLDKGHRFLLLKNDYPSIVDPVTRMGFDFQEVPIDDKMEEHILDAIEKFKPSVFSFSMVQYISGLRMNGDFIKKIKKDYPGLLIIADGTQFTGTTAFNFSSSGLDALVGSGYKWLLGGYGNGYVFLSNQMKEALYSGVKNKNANLLSDDKNYLSMYFEPGHLDSLNFGSLGHGLNYLQSLGLDNIEKTNHQL